MIYFTADLHFYHEKIIKSTNRPFRNADEMNKVLVRKWNGCAKGSICLHGHQHNHEDYNIANRREGILRYDVGVDANHMAPISAEEVIAFFAE